MNSPCKLVLLLWGLLLSGLQAEEALIAPNAADVGNEMRTTFLEILQQAGLMLYPLAALSVAALFLIIFYLLTIRQGAVVSDKFMNSADALIRKQDYLGLLAVCNRHGDAIARVMEKTLDFATKNPIASFSDIREVTEAEGTRQASLLNQRIAYLADIGGIAPMVGLLGTVIGMIKSFRGIGTMVTMGDKQGFLANGVSEALITTAGGLVIGIPAMIFYSIFRGKVQRLIAEMEAAATHLLALLGAQYKRSHTPPAKAPASGSSSSTRRYEEDYFTDYSMGDRTIDPRGL